MVQPKVVKKLLPLFLKEKLFVPLKLINEDLLPKLYSRHTFAEDNCARCDFLSMREVNSSLPPAENCDQCPSYLGRINLHKITDIKGKDYVALPLGNRKNLLKVVPKFKEYKAQGRVIDKRPRTKIHKGIKFVGKPHDYQVEAVEKLLAKKYGLLRSKPRSGKTVMATMLACEMKLKTLIMASQYDFLEQFYETICGSKKEKAFTNIPEIEKFTGRKLVGFCNTIEDFEKYDICLCTYQTFLSSHGKKRFNAIKNMFPLLIVDEVHQGSATEFSRIIANLNCYAKFGLTATVNRKDGKEWIIKEILGPVTAQTQVSSLNPVVELIDTPVHSTHRYSQWFQLENFLYKHPERNALIVKHIMRDIKLGRSIVIPITRVAHAKEIVDTVNRKWRKLGNEGNIAKAFTGNSISKIQRRQLILDARKGKIRLVVGTRKLIQHGLNVPRWDTYYLISLSSNGPGFYQESARILTPMEGKNTPLIKVFADDFQPTRGCLQTIYWRGIVPLKYKMTQETRKKFSEYLKAKTGAKKKPNFYTKKKIGNI